MNGAGDEPWEPEEKEAARPTRELRQRPPRIASAASSAGAPEGFRPLASLAFWCCLGGAAAILAAVFLAPRLRNDRDLRRQYDGLERELIAAQRRVDYFRKVVDALKHDSQFAAELARVDFGVAGDEERIPVPQALNLSGEPMSESAVTLEPSRPLLPNLLDTPLLDTFSDNRPARISLLAAASFLALIAFAFLCDTRTRLEETNGLGLRSRWREWLRRRYAARRS
jgi:hypothetical protein